VTSPATRRGFIHRLRTRAAARERRIGCPEADETRTALAIRRLRDEGWVRPVEIRAGAEGLANAAQRLATGELDGVVAGAVHPTADVIRAGLRVVGLADGVETVSAAFHMVFPAPDERVLTLTDAAVVPAPTPAQMAESASAACGAHRAVAGEEPVVAFLSYSTLGSAAGPAVEHVREAMDIFGHRRPEIAADGELQADTALVPDVAALKAPGSPVAGRANVPLVAVVAVSCLVAGLALAALDDITTGVEPDLALEWAFVSLAAAWFVGGGGSMWKRTSRRRREHRDAAPE